jgi:hypothetical protein
MTSPTSNDMATYTFDTLTYVKELVAASMPEAQAEVISLKQRGLIEHELATKADLKELELATKADLKRLELATKADLKKLELATKADIKSLEQSTKADMRVLTETTKAEINALKQSTHRDMKELELRLTHSLTLRLGSMMVVSVGVAASLATLL